MKWHLRRANSRFPLLGLMVVLLLTSLGCQKAPASIPASPKEVPAIQAAAWFGEGVSLAPHPLADFAWAAPGLDLREQVVDFAAWEVPAAPPQGEATEAWKEKRDRVTQMLQILVAEGLALAQQAKPPPEAVPAYRMTGRILTFDRQARVGAKTAQVLGNIALVPVNLALVLLSNGHLSQGLFIGGVSGYRTEVLYQVRLTDLRTQRTVLALQSWMDFKSLEAPTHLISALWTLGSREAATQDWWPGEPLHLEDGGMVWFKPGLDLRQARIRCLAWLPAGALATKVKESDLDRGLQATRMPRLLAGLKPDSGPVLSETEGDLYLQGECPGNAKLPRAGCRAKLWDPSTGQVLGLMQVTKGFWRTDVEQDWARRIRRHLLAQRGPSPDPGAAPSPSIPVPTDPEPAPGGR